MAILVTGAAGFIGSHVAEALLRRGDDVIAFDNLNEFYDPALKRRNLAEVAATAAAAGRRFQFHQADLRDADAVQAAFADGSIGAVVHLAAAAGVRPSIEQPGLYAEVNVGGTLHVLEAARAAGVRRVVFASSSSVYGNSPKVPFSEDDAVDHPISPYAATKKAGELLCHCWHHLHGLSVACLRFFTVYGPRQRPDLAISRFTRNIAAGAPIPLYGDGSSSRDYTYVDDIAAGVLAAVDWTRKAAPAYGIFNLGHATPVPLHRLVALIEQEVGQAARIERLPPQPGDVERTFADTGRAQAELGFAPTTSIEQGIAQYVAWFRAREAEVGVG